MALFGGKSYSVENLNETNRRLFPDNEVVSVLYGDCARFVDRKACNAYAEIFTVKNKEK